MDLGLNGKVAWITGASSGLGRASAEALATEGASVAVSARRREHLEQIVEEVSSHGGRALAVPLDVTDAGGIVSAHEQIAENLGPVDILVSNGGGPPPGGFDAFDDDALYGGFTLTTASAWRLTKAVLPAMKQRRGGVLIYLTSETTKEVVPTLLLSNMMRAAVLGMAKTLSKELGPMGIRALCVAPGRIATARLEQLDNATSERTGRPVEEVRAQVQGTIPLGRYGNPDEFGRIVAFLASERASYLSGISVSVDGGKLNYILA